MTINKNRKKRLLNDLKNKDGRTAFVESGVDVGVAFQICELRQKKEWTQKKLAEETGMKQERISSLENPSHSPTLSTLKKIAEAFDVGLIVRFTSFGDLVKWNLNLSSESLNIPSYEEDPYFKTNNDNISVGLVEPEHEISSANASDKVVSLKEYPSKTDQRISMAVGFV